MKSHAYCPHPDHRQTRIVLSPDDPEAKKAANNSTQPAAFVNFECPDCRIPVYCSERHWMDDYESHAEICDTLKQANEDDHDLHSGRFFPEFEYPEPQMEEIRHNMTNWDTLLYTREFKAIDDERAMRQVTRILTYPVTIASILHEEGPYGIREGGRMTVEGLKSFSGISKLAQLLKVRLTFIQLSITTCIHLELAQGLVSKACDLYHRQSGSSSLALAQSLPFLVQHGYSSSTFFIARACT